MPFPFISEERLANSVDTKFNTTNKICRVVLRRNGVYGNMVLPSCGQYILYCIEHQVNQL